METITVKVEKHEQAKMLVSWLNTINFVKDISLKKEENEIGNVSKVNDILQSVAPKQLFTAISNPVEFQNQLKNEW